MDRFNKRKWLYTKKARSRRYPAQTITDADYAEDTALPANTSAQAESQLHSLQKARDGIGLYVNADKTEYMLFNQNQTRDLSTLTDSSLKLADKFNYLGSSVKSTENDINAWLAKAWSAVDNLSVIWKSDLSNKIKGNFSKVQPCSYYYMGAPRERLQITGRKS